MVASIASLSIDPEAVTRFTRQGDEAAAVLVGDVRVIGFSAPSLEYSDAHKCYFSYVAALKLPTELPEERFAALLQVIVGMVLGCEFMAEKLPSERRTYFAEQLLEVLWTPYRLGREGAREALQECLEKFAHELTESITREDAIALEARYAVGRQYAEKTLELKAAPLEEVQEFFGNFGYVVEDPDGVYTKSSATHKPYVLTAAEADEFGKLMTHPCVEKICLGATTRWSIENVLNHEDYVDGYYQYLHDLKKDAE